MPRASIVAAIVLAAILVPQGMAYAELAGLPPVTGLYTTIACLVGYAVMGPSKILVLGPDSSLGPLIFAAVTPLVVAGDDDMVTLDHTSALFRAIQNSELAVVPGTSHYLAMEKPDLVNRLVLDFLEKDPVPTYMPLRRAPTSANS